MKTLDEIVNNYEEWSVFLDDRFGVRLAQFLTQEQLEKIGFKWNSDEPYPEPKEWTRENILVQLKEDVEFGFEKALDRRGISASLMFAVVLYMEQSSLRKAQRIIQRITMLCICHYLRLLRKSTDGRILQATIMGTKSSTMSSAMKESSILKAISDAIEEYEENQQRRIDLLESKILLFEREREAFIRHLREGNIQLLKDYLGIKDE